MSLFRFVVTSTAFAVPVTITVLDLLGYIAKVEGASMQPSLNPDLNRSADFVLLNRWGIRNYEFQHGEVVSLKCPINPDQKIIKRIIGLEGDTIKTLSYKNRYVQIPEGHCWIEGDHYGQSLDSNLFGPVALGLITARASHVVWPSHRWGRMTVRIPEGRVNVMPQQDENNDAQYGEVCTTE